MMHHLMQQQQCRIPRDGHTACMYAGMTVWYYPMSKSSHLNRDVLAGLCFLKITPECYTTLHKTRFLLLIIIISSALLMGCRQDYSGNNNVISRSVDIICRNANISGNAKQSKESVYMLVSVYMSI